MAGGRPKKRSGKSKRISVVLRTEGVWGDLLDAMTASPSDMTEVLRRFALLGFCFANGRLEDYGPEGEAFLHQYGALHSPARRRSPRPVRPNQVSPEQPADDAEMVPEQVHRPPAPKPAPVPAPVQEEEPIYVEKDDGQEDGGEEEEMPSWCGEIGG